MPASAKHGHKDFHGATRLLPHAVHTGTSVARHSTAGFTLVESIYRAGQRADRHAHESPFLGLTLSGRSINAIERSRDGELHEAGSICFLPAGWTHSHTTSGGLRGLTVDISPRYAADFADSGADLTRSFTLSAPEVSRLVHRLTDEIRSPDSLSALEVDALTVELCVFSFRVSRRSDSMSAPPWLRRIVSLVQERYNESFSLAELAAEAQVHPVHLARAFRRCYGETLGEHLRRLRIKEARRQLESSFDSIAEIAVSVGYHDESHFAKAFKKVVGTTPGHYRSVVRESKHLVL